SRLVETPSHGSALLLMPELGEWIRQLERIVQTWAMLPSRLSAFSSHLDLLQLLALPVFAREAEVEIQITVSGIGRLDFPDRGFSVSLPLKSVAAKVRLRADPHHVELPSGLHIPWDCADSLPCVTRHRRLSGGIFVRPS